MRLDHAFAASYFPVTFAMGSSLAPSRKWLHSGAPSKFDQSPRALDTVQVT